MAKRDLSGSPRGFRFDPKAIEAAQRIATELDRELSWVVREALDQYIERYRTVKRQKQS